jgi:hypothetical protein
MPYSASRATSRRWSEAHQRTSGEPGIGRDLRRDEVWWHERRPWDAHDRIARIKASIKKTDPPY